jgi:hypothetical protein
VVLIQVVLVDDNDERTEDALRSEFELWGVYAALSSEDKGLNDLLSHAGRFLPADRWLELNADFPSGPYFAPPLAFNNLVRMDFETLCALLPYWNQRRVLGPKFFASKSMGDLKRSVNCGKSPIWVKYVPARREAPHDRAW